LDGDAADRDAVAVYHDVVAWVAWVGGADFVRFVGVVDLHGEVKFAGGVEVGDAVKSFGHLKVALLSFGSPIS